VVQINWSKTGKHGHAKVFIVGIDIFTEKKYEECVPSSFSISVPVVNLSEYQVLHIEEDGFLFLLGEDSETRGDIPLPINKELKARIQRCIEQDKQLSVTVLSALSQEGVISSKLL
jgi:translation initiation factor 5A